MKVAIVSDVHVGNPSAFGGEVRGGLNERAHLTLDVLRRAVVRAKVLGCNDIIVLGDLFDTACPSPQMVRATYDVLGKMWSHLLVGNHELVSTAKGDHALASMPIGGNVVDVADEEVEWEFDSSLTVRALPYRSQARLDLKGEGITLLLMHQGIVTAETPPFLRDAPDALKLVDVEAACKEIGASACFAGHWHRRMLAVSGDDTSLLGQTVVMQVGALCPLGFRDLGLEGYGTLAIYDSATDEVTVEEIPGPRFLVLNGLREYANVIAHEDLSTVTELFIRLYVPHDDAGEARALAVIAHVHVEVMIDKADTEVAARSAATAVRSAETLDEALAAFVAQMQLPEGVDRQRVLGLARTYLNGGT
jgi:hypothetical protein